VGAARPISSSGATRHRPRARSAGFDETRWAAARFEIVVRGSVAKFAQNRELLAYLVDTGERVLVEASPVDRIWGIGLRGEDARSQNPDQWRGLNLLGFALMEARRQLVRQV
jgi:ribA/ribD-fused uncharacterized protein